jgi:preprotein translocase subunit SecD
MKSWGRSLRCFLFGLMSFVGVSCNTGDTPPSLSFHLVSNQSLCRSDDDGVGWPPEPVWTVDTNRYMRCIQKIYRGEELLWVQREPVLTGEDIAGAEVEVRKNNITAADVAQYNVEHPELKIDLKEIQNVAPTPELFIEFTESGARRLQAVTKVHKDERMAIMSGQQIIMAPKILTEITDGRIIVSGVQLSEKELRKLASRIEATSRRDPNE